MKDPIRRRSNKQRITSEALFADNDVVLIRHESEWYVLRKVRNGGLLLTRWTGEVPSAAAAETRLLSRPADKRRRIGLFGRRWLGNAQH